MSVVNIRKLLKPLAVESSWLYSGLMSSRFSKLKVGLALGGGAARGVVHLGVLQRLEYCGIQIDCISGTSIGSAIGALYAINPDASSVAKKFIRFLHSDDFKGANMNFLTSSKDDEKQGVWGALSQTFRKSVFYGISLANKSFLHEDILSKNLDQLIPDICFSDCKIPFSCCATDLKSKQAVVFNKGDLRPALLASCSIPGIFPPIVTEDSVLIDGSWVVQNPVKQVREMGADFVIAVDIMLDDQREPAIGNSFDVLISGGVVTRGELARLQLEDADVVICPNTKDIHWADFTKAPRCIKRGRKEAEKMIPEITSKIKKAKLMKLLKGITK